LMKFEGVAFTGGALGSHRSVSGEVAGRFACRLGLEQQTPGLRTLGLVWFCTRNPGTVTSTLLNSTGACVVCTHRRRRSTAWLKAPRKDATGNSSIARKFRSGLRRGEARHADPAEGYGTAPAALGAAPEGRGRACAAGKGVRREKLFAAREAFIDAERLSMSGAPRDCQEDVAASRWTDVYGGARRSPEQAGRPHAGAMREYRCAHCSRLHPGYRARSGAGIPQRARDAARRGREASCPRRATGDGPPPTSADNYILTLLPRVGGGSTPVRPVALAWAFSRLESVEADRTAEQEVTAYEGRIRMGPRAAPPRTAWRGGDFAAARPRSRTPY